MKNVEKVTVKSLMQNDTVKQKFSEICGKNAANFMASVVQISNSKALMNCEPKTILSAAIVAASLNLSVDPALGQAAIVPYVQNATFQIMYKGMVQLCLRSAQMQTINMVEVHEGEIIGHNIVTGELKFSEKRFLDSPIIGYVAYFRLLNGFEKMLYMTKEQISTHGKRYSKMFNSGVWKSDFDKMAMKTVLKLLLDKYAPKSSEMQMALHFDNKQVNLKDSMDINESETIDIDFLLQESEIPEGNLKRNTDQLILLENEK